MHVDDGLALGLRFDRRGLIWLICLADDRNSSTFETLVLFGVDVFEISCNFDSLGVKLSKKLGPGQGSMWTEDDAAGGTNFGAGENPELVCLADPDKEKLRVDVVLNDDL